MLKFIEAEVTVSECQVQRVEVRAWELPILQAIHARADIKVVGSRLVEGETPNAAAEFERLEVRYRNVRNEDGSKGIPFVASVYGQGREGVRELARAITQAAAEQPAEGLEASAARASSAARHDVDDLLISSVGG